MERTEGTGFGRAARLAGWGIAAALLLFFGWAQVMLGARLLLGGTAFAFLVEPLVERFERRAARPWAVALSLTAVALGLTGLACALAPPLVRQSAELVRLIPEGLKRLKPLADRWIARLGDYGLTGEWSGFDAGSLAGSLGGMAAGAADMAGGLFEGAFHLTMAVMLGVYFLLDRARLLLQLELLTPSRFRPMALQMAAGIKRELRGYLRGQLAVCGVVAALAAAGLALVGVASPLPLGALVGLFNIIPYFGPVLGGAPVVVAALSQGPARALAAIVVLFAVQQADSMIVSPRVMSGVTGMSPAAVLLSLTLGGSKWGVAGMLVALPIYLIVRICVRVWASRNETIENRRKV